ncbi:MAPEG family protein [Acuticoccus sp.]|uniref:MAPEG family protein n=1 Tax=Acuticoccus sp. TaxID=1904378 RepID=UPI003B51B94B
MPSDVPFTIALWCVLAAAVLPILAVYPAKFDPELDNRDPRARHAQQTGLRRRAFAAHQNGFEAFALFAVAVLVATITGADRGWVDALALVFIATRVLYTLAYYANLSLVRSGLFSVGFGASVAIFTASLWA